MSFTIRDTMKVQNTSFFHLCYNTMDGSVYHFDPGEVKEIPNKYIFMTDDGFTLKQPDLKVIETLPDLLEEVSPMPERWEMLDFRQ